MTTSSLLHPSLVVFFSILSIPQHFTALNHSSTLDYYRTRESFVSPLNQVIVQYSAAQVKLNTTFNFLRHRIL